MKLEVGKTYALVSDKDAIVKVIAEVSGCNSPKRYWVEIRNYRKTHGEFVTQSFSDGKNVGYYTAYDLMEIPPEPRKKERWVHLIEETYSPQKHTYTIFSDKKDCPMLSDTTLLCSKKITLVEGEFDD